VLRSFCRALLGCCAWYQMQVLCAASSTLVLLYPLQLVCPPGCRTCSLHLTTRLFGPLLVTGFECFQQHDSRLPSSAFSR
jgi:hypothetical protein